MLVPGFKHQHLQYCNNLGVPVHQFQEVEGAQMGFLCSAFGYI